LTFVSPVREAETNVHAATAATRANKPRNTLIGEPPVTVGAVVVSTIVALTKPDHGQGYVAV
jgi:hypothetical protein